MSEVRLGSRGLGEVDFAGERSSRDVFFVMVDGDKKKEGCCGRRYVGLGTKGTGCWVIIFFSFFLREFVT